MTENEKTGKTQHGSRTASTSRRAPRAAVKQSATTRKVGHGDAPASHSKRTYTTTKRQLSDTRTRAKRVPVKTASRVVRKMGSPKRRDPGAGAPKRREVKKHDIIPPITGDNIRIIPLGGVEEVGKNMTIVENKDDIFIFDVGFQFSEDETPGIDYILPDTKYLEENKHKIRGAIITHGHLDHVGGIPYIMDKLGNPPLYSRDFTSLIIKKRQEEFPHLPPLDIKIVEPGQRIKLGSTMLKFFAVTHSIPDAMGIIVETPHGNIVISGDLRLEHDAGIPSEKEEKNWGEISKQNNLLFIGDSTNAENPGFSVSDSIIFANLEKIIKEAPSRLIIGTFASQVERMIKIIEICEKYNKKVITEGRSMKTNIEISKIAGLIKPKDDTFIQAQEAS
ncbi:Ribonuclease J (endonuclease and 5' exonuclease), partial [hydrothermal vent metagenome]